MVVVHDGAIMTVVRRVNSVHETSDPIVVGSKGMTGSCSPIQWRCKDGSKKRCAKEVWKTHDF